MCFSEAKRPLCYVNLPSYSKHYAEENDHDALQIIFEDYFFKIADSFGLSGILEAKDLYLPDFFEDWDIQVKDELVETSNGDIVATFHLNDSCKAQLLKEEYPYQPIRVTILPDGKTDYKAFKKGEFSESLDAKSFYYPTYYQFTYFFKKTLCLGYFLHYETQFILTNTKEYVAHLDSLPERIRLNIEPIPPNARLK